MIVYFDILSLDNSSLLSARHSERRKHLERIIQPIPGRSEVVFRQEIDFGHRLAASHLRKAFAAVIMQRGEGLVVKPDEAYFDFSPGQRRFASSCIKLKKEYIGNFGEVGDFAVVGAGFDAARAKSYGIPGLKWTHFYLGCLNNKEEVARWGAKPDFTVVSIVELNDTQLRSFVVHCQTDAVPQRDNKATTIKLAAGLIRQPPLSVAFTQPPVVDVRCFSFDKEGNTGFWTPRFPGVSKIHFDRDFVDTVTFDELQAIAQEATSTPELEDSQENLQWIARLERADPRGIAVDATSQLTASSLATPSPRRRTQSFSEGGSPVSPRRSASQPLVGRANAFFDGSPIPLKLPRSAAQQITPPTSSAAQESSSTSKKTQGGQKRRPVSDLRDSPTKRRGSATLTHEPSKGEPGRAGSSPMLPERIPLGNIKGNGSQQSPVSATRRSNHKVLIDLTLSPTSSQVSESAVMSAVIDENDCLQTTAITIPDAEDAIQSREAPQKDTHMLTEDAPLDVCKFAGSLCQFAETQLALAPHLQKSTHIIRRLGEHGIIAPQLDFGEFSATVKSMVKSRPGTAILLVDSVRASRQTRVVLDDLEQSLDTDTTMERSWVHVFDWRVLDTISKLEDQSVRPAGFEGFSGPWRRWHVGVL
jgi:DNA ligase-4